ncbi:unnamed protein product, partial [Rangifer tarandus platyrhynchus]
EMQLEGEVLGGGALCQLHQAEPPLGIPLPAWLRDSWSRSGCGGSKQSRCGPCPPHLRRSPPRVEVHSGLRLLDRPAVLLQLLQLRGQAFSSVTKALTSAGRRTSQRRGSQLSIPLAACSSHLRPPSGACSQPPSLPSAWCPVESSLQLPACKMLTARFTRQNSGDESHDLGAMCCGVCAAVVAWSLAAPSSRLKALSR